MSIPWKMRQRNGKWTKIYQIGPLNQSNQGNTEHILLCHEVQMAKPQSLKVDLQKFALSRDIFKSNAGKRGPMDFSFCHCTEVILNICHSQITNRQWESMLLCSAADGWPQEQQQHSQPKESNREAGPQYWHPTPTWVVFDAEFPHSWLVYNLNCLWQTGIKRK